MNASDKPVTAEVLVERFMQHRRATSVCWDLPAWVKRLLSIFAEFCLAQIR